MANVLVFEDNYLAIQTLEEIGGTVNNAADSLYANASLIALGNDSISTVISSQIITTPEISVGDFNSNISINSTAFSATSYGDSNTYIDAYQAIFSGVVTIESALILNSELNANGEPGTDGQVLVSNGSIPYWSDTANNTSFVGTVSAANVVSNAQLSGNLANYVTAFNLSNNLANYAALSDPIFTGKITVNTFVTIGNTSQNVVANSSAISINGSLVANSTYFSGQALTANNANNLGGVAASGYQTTAGLSSNVATLTANAATYLNGKTESNLNVNNALTANDSSYLGSVAAASYVNTSGSYTISGVHTHSGNLVIGTTAGVSANGDFGTAGQYLASNGTSVYWTTGVSSGFTNGQSISVNNFVITGAMTANSSNGTSGQVLTSNGSSVYWANVSNTSANSQTFTGNGTNTIFTLAQSVDDQDSILVILDGLVQTPNSNYTASSTTLTFDTAPVNNTSIEVRYLNAVSVGGGGGGGGGASANIVFGYNVIFGG